LIIATSTPSLTPKTDTAALDQELNNMVLSGKALEAFEQFYADDVVMQENNDEPRIGKETNRKFEQEFFSSLASLERWPHRRIGCKWRHQLFAVVYGHNVQERLSGEDDPGCRSALERRQNRS